MRSEIRVRGYMNVTITVPHEFTVDRTELNEWLTADGSPEWDGDADTLRDFITSDLSDEWKVGWTSADPDRHSVEESELVEVEVLGVRDV